MVKFIFVTGGVASSLGKGVQTSSLGALLKAQGYSVNIVKCDPYLNIDAGTMSPIEHGEVFVTEDGGETDLDLGNYERYLNQNLSADNNITTGKVYKKVQEKERSGAYLGKTVQIIPHITDEITNMIMKNCVVKKKIKSMTRNNSFVEEKSGKLIDLVSKPLTESIRQQELESPIKNRKKGNVDALRETFDQGTQTIFNDEIPVEKNEDDTFHDIILIEIGGTVGDIESQPFQEVERQMIMKLGSENCLSIHLTLVPFLVGAGEFKTKPTQHSAKELRVCGIQPDAIVCRSEAKIPNSVKSKISQFTNVAQDAVFSCWNAESVYLVPLNLYEEGISHFVTRKLKLDQKEPQIEKWIWMQESFNYQQSLDKEKTVVCGVVGKYFENLDSYKSLIEAQKVSSIHNRRRLEIRNIDGEQVTDDKLQESCDCILVPGGFGIRGTEGKLKAITYARTKNVPYFGICLGMQLACVEFARNVCGIKDANSMEFDYDCKDPIIILISKFLDQLGHMQKRDITGDMGGTLRLGIF